MSTEKPALATDENSLPAKVDVEAEIANLAAQTGDHAERIRSSLAQLTSNSGDELGRVMSELQEVREFLRLEAERLQSEFANYAQIQQSALAAANIISQTIGPWKSNLITDEARNSRARPLIFSSRGNLKRWPAG